MVMMLLVVVLLAVLVLLSLPHAGQFPYLVEHYRITPLGAYDPLTSCAVCVNPLAVPGRSINRASR